MEVLIFVPVSTLNVDQYHPDYLVIMQRVPFTASGPMREHLEKKQSEICSSFMTKHSVRNAARESVSGRLSSIHLQIARNEPA